jgi:hypothetical protein
MSAFKSFSTVRGEGGLSRRRDSSALSTLPESEPQVRRQSLAARSDSQGTSFIYISSYPCPSIWSYGQVTVPYYKNTEAHVCSSPAYAGTYCDRSFICTSGSSLLANIKLPIHATILLCKLTISQRCWYFTGPPIEQALDYTTISVRLPECQRNKRQETVV